ncbi:ABC transporter ATP-binding protein [Pengzhenrongella sp.]|jgi:NitT/TauT family transport system ATP-binding protein|uniref:ABC transporter ATP-binding protein n=1 Tax=Pengzhenrongella sp. TaxID=2888820 RepID=UPI002F931626
MTTAEPRIAASAPAPALSGAGVAPELPAAVRLRGVTKRFAANGPDVLDGIDLTIAPGEFVCLLGASGCGKSTLLNIVAGLEPATSGTVQVAGDGAALMFQEAALLPWLTAQRNVELALRLRGVGRVERKEKASELLDLVHLGAAGNKAVHELSGGMRQRVALARSLAQERNVLLMDEPFGALDAITRDLLHVELERIWLATGRTVVFITHNVREAVRLGQRVLLMSSRPGRIVREWQVDVHGERRIEAPEVGALAVEITDHLREEIRRHAAI